MSDAVAVEQSLVKRAQRGDTGAFTALLREYDERLRVLAFRLLGDRDRMDDVLQEAYLKAFRALKGFRGDSLPPPGSTGSSTTPASTICAGAASTPSGPSG